MDDLKKYIKEERLKEISDKASEIRQKYDLGDMTFDLIDFLIKQEHFEIKSQVISDNTTGLLFVDDDEYIPNSNSHRVIIINENIGTTSESSKKKRFICAHEYGHFLLHKHHEKKFAHRDTAHSKTTEELEAEYFAYCFLLPEKTIRLLFDNQEVKNQIDRIAKKFNLNIVKLISIAFNVTEKKVRKRLKMLGLTAS